ncbi:MAG: hypothetical protein ACOVO0_04710 [Burkholderiaceae bacterium]
MKPNHPHASSWRSIRLRRQQVAAHFTENHSLRWHCFWIASLTLLCMGLASYMLRHTWADGSLGVRYLVVLGVAYGVYLLLVRLWAGYMSRRQHSDSSPDDVPMDVPSGGAEPHSPCGMPTIQSGGGGDCVGDASGPLLSEGSETLLSGAAEAIGSADEGAIVLVPVLAVFALLVAVLSGAGLLVSLLFGTDVLLAVTVELAMAATAGRMLYRVAQENWLDVALGLTWKPMLGIVVCAMLAGFLADYFFPGAQSMTDVLRAIIA